MEYTEYYWNYGAQNPISNYSKTKENQQESIKALTALIESRPDITFERKDADFVLRFLYARKFDISASFQLLINYHLFKEKNKELFQKIEGYQDPLCLALRDGFPGVLTQRDRKGCRVLVIYTAVWDHLSYSLVTIYRSLLFTLEKLVENQLNQMNGFLMLIDWSEFTFKQSTNLNPKILKLMIEGLQDCFPAKFKGIHFINQPWYIEAMLKMIRPFLKEKTKNKIYLHGNNLSTLHNFICKDILPAELGGEGPSFNPSIWAEKIITSTEIEDNF